MATGQELIERRQEIMPRGLAQFAGNCTAVSADGARLIDADGRELIDFAGGIGVMNVGHGNRAVVEAITNQAKQLQHVCIHVATYEPYLELCEKLAELFPHGEKTKVMLTNTGTEAVENAVKIARQATGRQAILCYSEAFHGRTMMSMTLTSKARYKKNCGPFAPEVYRVPYPNHYRYGDGLPMEAFIERELARLEDAFMTLVPAEHVAAVIIEPVQGEGGFVPAPAAYLKGLRETCSKYGILLIVDEVQSGFCRTGRWAAYQHAGIVPDLSTWAKSMGGGLPIGCVIGRADIMDEALPGTLGGTYGGNPIACAASLAAIEVMQEMKLDERAESMGKRIRTRLANLEKRCGIIGDIRGLGAMIGVELSHGKNPRQPATAETAEILQLCLNKGLLILSAGSYMNVIRILAPLIITDDDLEQGINILEQSVLEIGEM